jgi:hypothetical protein
MTITQAFRDRWLLPANYVNTPSVAECGKSRKQSEGYLDTAKALDQKPIVIAGYRLADYLKAAFRSNESEFGQFIQAIERLDVFNNSHLAQYTCVNISSSRERVCRSRTAKSG